MTTLPDWSPKKPKNYKPGDLARSAGLVNSLSMPPHATASPTFGRTPTQPGIKYTTGSKKGDAALTKQNYASSSPAGASASIASQGSTLGSTPGGSYSGVAAGGGGGYGGGGGGAGGVALPAEPKVTSEKDWLAEDSIYDTEQAQLKKTLDRMKAEYGWFDNDGDLSNKGDWQAGRLQKSYDVDFGKNLRDLGWDEEADAWRQDDRLASYGSAYNNQLEDFAGRGMLDSSAYQQALMDMNRGFDDQMGSMRTGRDNYISDLQTQWNDSYAENEEALQRAKMDSLMRRAAEFSLPFNS